MSWTAIALLLVAAAAGWALYFRILCPLGRLREVLRRLAAGDFRPVLGEPRGIFRQASEDMQKIADQLQHLDRQIAEEGFSLRAILSAMVEGVLITDRTQRIRLANKPLLRMFGLRESPVNRTVMEVFRRHELHQALEKTLADGKPRRIDLSIRTPQGGNFVTRHFDVHAGALDPQGTATPTGAVVVFHDVTEVKTLEGVRREFLANVSHEFRTPLTIINGYVETLLDGALDDRAMAERSLRVMQQNGQRLVALIEDLLTISQMEHRAAQLALEVVDLREVLDRVLSRLEPAIAERQARIELDWPQGLGSSVEADPRRIEQVFANLLENALRHGAPKDGVVAVVAQSLGREIAISFRDNGPGIPIEDQPHIFERFYRVHKDRSRAGGGTGLGLSIVKHVVNAHRGHVTVESAPGTGACFRIVLPLRNALVAVPENSTHAN